MTRDYPSDERFGLTDQLRRAVVSVSSTIAEGHARTRSGSRSYLSIARGSTAEVQSQLLLSVELGFTTETRIHSLLGCCDEIRRMTAAMIRKLKPPK